MFSVIAIIAFIGVMPLLVGNLEIAELNEQTRTHLDGSFIELSAGTTHYEIRGHEDYKTIVLVHGNAAPYVTWDNNIDALVNAGFRVLRYDVFGHGFSDRPKLEKYGRDLYDNQLVELLDKLAITAPIYLIGTSQGGSISAYFGANHKEKVIKLALLSPFFDRYEGARSAALLKTPFIGEYLIRLIGDKLFVNPSENFYIAKEQSVLTKKLAEQMSFKGKKRAILANLRGDALDDATAFYAEAKKQAIPILLTWGKQDQRISGQSMNRLRTLIPEIKFHEIENAGHLAHYEHPESINPILINFLND